MKNEAITHIKRRMESLQNNPPQSESEYKAAYKQAIDDLEVALRFIEELYETKRVRI